MHSLNLKWFIILSITSQKFWNLSCQFVWINFPSLLTFPISSVCSKALHHHLLACDTNQLLQRLPALTPRLPASRGAQLLPQLPLPGHLPARALRSPSNPHLHLWEWIEFSRLFWALKWLRAKRVPFQGLKNFTRKVIFFCVLMFFFLNSCLKLQLLIFFFAFLKLYFLYFFKLNKNRSWTNMLIYLYSPFKL